MYYVYINTINTFKKLLKKITHNQSGATAIEYGLIVGLMAAIIISVLAIFQDGLTDLFTDIANKLRDTIKPD